MKKLFSIFFALAMLLPVSIQAQTDDLHIPQAAKSPEAIQVETVEVQILYTYVNDARSTNSLYQLQIYSSDNLFAVAVPVSSSSQWIVNSFSRTANSAIYTTAASKLSDAAECTGTVINAWGNYYNFNVYIRGNGSYDKYYHLKGYFNSSSLDGTAKLTNDETGGGTFWTNFPTVSSTKSGTTTILTASYSGSENKGTRTNTLKLYFNQTNTSYAPSGLYNISNAGTLGTVKNASGNDNSTNFTSRWTRTGYGTTYNYWYLSAGQVVVFNPNCKSTPIFFQVAAINTANKVVGLMYGTPPAGKYELTVSTYGTGASGSATISCAEGHGYANSTLVDFTYPGSYYYDGTTVTLEAPDAQEGYRFTKWTKGSSSTSLSTKTSYQFDVSSTNSGAYVANFEGNSYTVHFDGNDNTDGSMSNQTGFKYGTGTALTSNAFSRVYTVTYNYHDATSGNGTASDDATYTFNGWNTAADGSGTTYTNGFSLSTPTPIPSHDGTVNLYAQWNSASVTLPSPEKTDHKFLGWYTEETGGNPVGGAGDSYIPTAGITLHAQWESSVTPEIVLNEEGEQHTLGGVATNKTLDDLASDYASRDVNVTIGRTLYGGSWNTIVFPFGVANLDVEGNELYDILRNSLYELQPSTTTATADGMIINFLPLSYEDGDMPLKAGKPYLIRTSADVNLNSYPFNGVRLTSEFSSVTDGDAVDFVPIKEKEKINYDAANLAIFIVGNRLYYPNKTTGTNLRGFRAYLRIKNGTYYGSPVRIRIADTGETITLDEEQEIETRKYVEDGILIIERGGVRYDAQGKRME